MYFYIKLVYTSDVFPNFKKKRILVLCVCTTNLEENITVLTPEDGGGTFRTRLHEVTLTRCKAAGRSVVANLFSS